jgi:hypothetical protein
VLVFLDVHFQGRIAREQGRYNGLEVWLLKAGSNDWAASDWIWTKGPLF